MTAAAHIGQRMRERRRALNLSQATVGEAAGVSAQQVHKYESGETDISARRLWMIGRRLDVSLDWFFEGKEP